MTTPWTLQVFESGQRTREIMAKDGLLIGRHPECGLVLTDSRVSARHCKLVKKGHDLAVQDLGSNNGTHIDGAHVLREDQHQTLRNGMSIQVGHVELRVVGPAKSEPTLYAPPGDSQDTVMAPADELDDALATRPEGSAPTMAEPTLDPPTSAPAAADSNDTVAGPAPVQEAPPTPIVPVSPAPAPAPIPPPHTPAPAAPAAPPTPAAHGHDSSFSAFDTGAGQTIIGDVDDPVGNQAKLSRMGARLLLLNDADLRALDINVLDFRIGRGSSANCSTKHRGVSTEHARIEFKGASNLFMVEDLGSANGTQIDGVPLTANSPRELRCDTHLRFGGVDAVFLQAMDADFVAVPEERHANAAKLLKARGQLSAAVIRQAEKDAKQQGVSLGEVLLLGRHIGPREWTRAVEDSRMAEVLLNSGGGSDKRWLYVALGVAVLLAILLAIPSTRSMLGL